MTTPAPRLLLFASGTVAAALVVGAIMGTVSGSLYFVLVFPLGLAVAVGAIGRSLVRVLRVTNTPSARVVGVVAGLIAMLMMLVVEVQLERARVVSELTGKDGVSDASLDRLVDNHMAKLTGDVPVWQRPVALRIETGATLVGDAALDLGNLVNGLILLAELIAVAWLTGRLVRSRAAEPFCARCGTWYARRIIGSAPIGARSSLLGELQAQRYHRLGRRLQPPGKPGPVLLHGRFCDTCDTGEVRFELEVKEAGKRPRVVKSVTTGHDALDAILDSRALMNEKRSDG